jgi:hydrogenase expression/formation protein HypE
VLDRVIASMAYAARVNDVMLVAGDTKVVERGRADGLYVNTTGVGTLDGRFRPRADGVETGDVLLISAPIAQHGMAIMSAREGLEFEAQIESDSASLVPLVHLLRERVGTAVHALRDPTRGGVASALNELAAASNVGVVIEEAAINVPAPVAAACEMLGLDPLYVANEGVLVAFVDPLAAPDALAALRSHPLGTHAAIAGRAVGDHEGMVVLHTRIGSRRVVDMLPGDQLPRIC